MPIEVLPLTYSSESLAGEAFDLYDNARRNSDWDLRIDWKRMDHDAIDPSLRDVAWYITSQASYVEQLGMITSARLLGMCPHYVVRLNLARATADEARHSETFARYSILAKGDVAPPSEGARSIEFELNRGLPFEENFLTHTLLETTAVEQFGYIAKIFDGHFLAELYKVTRVDEARHVALGLNYLASIVHKEPKLAHRFRSHLENVRDVYSLDDNTIESLAEYSGDTAHDVRANFENRIGNFIERVLAGDTGTNWEPFTLDVDVVRPEQSHLERLTEGLI